MNVEKNVRVGKQHEGEGKSERNMGLVEQAVEEYAVNIKELIKKVNQIAISVKVPEIEELAMPEIQDNESYQHGEHVSSFYIEPFVEKVFTKEDLMKIDVHRVNEAVEAMEYIPNLAGDIEEARTITLDLSHGNSPDVAAAGQELFLRKATLEAVLDCARKTQYEQTKNMGK